MCDEGRFTYKEIRERRVAGARVLGEPAPLDKAMAFAAERLGRTARDLGAPMGVVLNAQATNEDNCALAAGRREALGITHVYMAGRAHRARSAPTTILRSADVNPNTAGVRLWPAPAPRASRQLLATTCRRRALRGLWILGDHVDLDEEAQAALEKLDVVVYQSPHENFLSDRGARAPAGGQLGRGARHLRQRQGAWCSGCGAAVEPPGEARPHHELISLVAHKLGLC